MAERTLFEGFQYCPGQIIEEREIVTKPSRHQTSKPAGRAWKDDADLAARFPRLWKRFGQPLKKPLTPTPLSAGGGRRDAEREDASPELVVLVLLGVDLGIVGTRQRKVRSDGRAVHRDAGAFRLEGRVLGQFRSRRLTQIDERRSVEAAAS